MPLTKARLQSDFLTCNKQSMAASTSITALAKATVLNWPVTKLSKILSENHKPKLREFLKPMSREELFDTAWPLAYSKFTPTARLKDLITKRIPGREVIFKHRKQMARMSFAERDAIDQYTSFSSGRWNTALREHGIEGASIVPGIRDLIRVVRASDTGRFPITIYHGSNFKDAENIGDTVDVVEFMSTAYDPHVSMHFMRGQTCCMWALTVPPHSRGLLPSARIAASLQTEMILAPPIRLTATGFKEFEGLKVIQGVVDTL